MDEQTKEWKRIAYIRSTGKYLEFWFGETTQAMQSVDHEVRPSYDACCKGYMLSDVVHAYDNAHGSEEMWDRQFAFGYVGLCIRFDGDGNPAEIKFPDTPAKPATMCTWERMCEDEDHEWSRWDDLCIHCHRKESEFPRLKAINRKCG